MLELTEFDKSLLNLLQGSIALSQHPFRDMAEKLGSDEQTVIDRINLLKENGYVRRIGAFFNSEKLGYTGTLVAVSVKPDKIASVAEAINKYPGITHNYERECDYNLWFTLLTPDSETHDRIINEIGALPGVEKLMDLSARRKYKINVRFNLK